VADDSGTGASAASEIDAPDSLSEPPAEAGVERSGAALARPMVPILSASALLAWLSFWLPEIALDGPLADFVVRVADTASWTQMPMLVVIAAVIITSRPGIPARRRAVEALVIAVVSIVALAGVAQLNEHVVKPALATSRPNLDQLAEAGALGPEIETGADFYALGDKQDRRDALAPLLDTVDEPALSPRVRAHWVHETGYTFPSGHATSSMTFATVLVALGFAWLSGWRQWLFAATPLWALCVVYSRPLLRVHRPIDVAVGTLQGIAIGLVAFVAINWLADRISHGSRTKQTS